MSRPTVLALIAAASLPCAARDSSGPPRRAGVVDLLKLIDLGRDPVRGEWKFEGASLVCPPIQFGRIQIPYVPPAEYDIRAVVERKGGGNSFNLGLAAGEVQFLVILDGSAMSGLDLVDGKSFYANETTVKGQILQDGARTVVRCSVRKDRVSVWVGDRKAIDWATDFRRLSLYPSWKMPSKDTLFLGSFQGNPRIHALELTPVSGPGRPSR